MRECLKKNKKCPTACPITLFLDVKRSRKDVKENSELGPHNTREALKPLSIAFEIIQPALIMPLRPFMVVSISEEPS